MMAVEPPELRRRNDTADASADAEHTRHDSLPWHGTIAEQQGNEAENGLPGARLPDKQRV
jgi:hypothetical protein